MALGRYLIVGYLNPQGWAPRPQNQSLMSHVYVRRDAGSGSSCRNECARASGLRERLATGTALVTGTAFHPLSRDHQAEM